MPPAAPTPAPAHPASTPAALPRVAFLGGNGHASGRLEAARAAAAGRFELVDAPYPGFEGRPRAAGLEAFLEAVAESVAPAGGPSPALVYATGVGATLALALRARDRLRGAPLLIQGGVLWGLELRLFPKLMRPRPARAALRLALRVPAVQRRFARRHFTRALDEDERAVFFDGYARCAAFGDLFDWIGAPLLRDLERAFAADPARLADLRVWWGARDTVVGLDELAATERALGVALLVRVFDGWGHYPMIDAPAEWAEELALELDRALVLP